MARVARFVLGLSIVASASARGQSETWRVARVGQQEFLGQSAAWIDDVDGDGRPDFAVGLPADAGDDETGRVRFHSGATGARILEIASTHVGDRFGWLIAAVGDLDGDGRRDLAITAPDRKTGAAFDGALELRSTASGALLRLHDNATTPTFGSAVAAMADLDGDGVGDYLSSCMTPGTGGAGMATLLSGASGAVLHSTQPGVATTSYGHALQELGDVDLDGVSDYAVGDPNRVVTGGFGAADVWSGATGAPIRTLTNLSIKGATGWAMARAGDLDGDGRADLLLGDPFWYSVPLVQDGRVAAVSAWGGGTIWTTATFFRTEWLGANLSRAGDLDGDGDEDLVAGELVAYSPVSSNIVALDLLTGARIAAYPVGPATEGAVDATADVDGDGVNDVLAGQPRSDPIDQDLYAGRWIVLDPVTGAIRHQEDGHAFDPAIGPSVVLDDLDGDGWRELAVGWPGGDGSNIGAVKIVSGQDGSEMGRIDGGFEGDRFGDALAVVADQDGDAIADLVVGSPGLGFPTQPQMGYVELRSTATGAVLRSFPPSTGSGRYGSAVAAAVDATGVWRIAIGDLYHKAGGSSAKGRVELFELATGMQLASIDGAFSGEYYGTSLAVGPDKDGDGVRDWLVGAPTADSSTPGSLDLLHGTTGAVLWSVTSNNTAGWVGSVVCSIGDLNGDGFDDVVTARHFTSTLFPDGNVSVRSGKNGTKLFLIVPPLQAGGAESRFGADLAVLGDVDRDGYDDFAVGRPWWSEVAYRAGMVQLYSGRTALPLHRILGSEADGQFGERLGAPSLFGTTRVDPDRTPDVVASGWQELVLGRDASAIALHRLRPLWFTIDPPVAPAGSTFTATTVGGAPNGAAGLFGVELNGAPWGVFLSFDFFDATGTLVLTEVAPPAMAGDTLLLRTYGIDAAGKLLVSEDATLTIQ